MTSGSRTPGSEPETRGLFHSEVGLRIRGSVDLARPEGMQSLDQRSSEYKVTAPFMWAQNDFGVRWIWPLLYQSGHLGLPKDDPFGGSSPTGSDAISR